MRSLFRKIREANRPFCTALVAAAGSSSRMGGTDKLMEFLDNVPVLMRTLTALQRAAAIDEIIIAAREDALVDISTLCKTYGITKCSKVVRGGESRCHSVLLAALEASPEAKLLAVQDGARPLVTPALIDRTVEAAAKCGAAAPAVPVKDTIKTVAEDGAAGVQIDGLATVHYTGTAPTVGYDLLCADGAGNVTAAEQNGFAYLVAAVDEEAKTAVIKL